MTTYVATATLAPTGVAITWLDEDIDQSTEMSILDFVDALRAVAARTRNGETQALVLNMSQAGTFAQGALTRLMVNKIGSMAYSPADQGEWTAAQRPAAGGPGRTDAPMAASTRAATPGATSPGIPTPASLGSPPAASAEGGPDQLFDRSFAATPDSRELMALPEINLAVANSAGGAGKTTISVLLAQAAAALAGHNDVVVIDINPSGNIVDRTRRTAPGDIHSLAQVAGNPAFGRSPRDFDSFVNWQPGGWSTVVCPPSIISDQGEAIADVSGQELFNIASALRRVFRVQIFDTGNNPKNHAWQAAVRNSHKILVPVQWDPDTMIRAQTMVSDMRKMNHHNLKERVIWVGTHTPAGRPERRREKGYRQALLASGWTIKDIPPDRHIATKGIIEWDKLSPKTRRAATQLVEASLA